MQKQAPKVSVIIPVYNAEPYLSASLGGVCAQTLRDIEIICVDDGSTDASLSILNEFAARDGRIRVLSQKNQFAGVARNRGIEAATGDYLMFLDADDLFEPQMIERMLLQCVTDHAQICIDRTDIFHMGTGKYQRNNPLPRSRYPAAFPFRPKDYADYFFQFISPVPYNKLIARKLIMDSGIRFEPRQRANDLFFAFCISVCANAITYVDEVLLHIRRDQTSNLQSGNQQSPFDFAEALLSVQRELTARGLFACFRRSYVNAAVHHAYYTVKSQKTCQGRAALLEALNGSYFTALGVLDCPKDTWHTWIEYASMERMRTVPAEQWEGPAIREYGFLLWTALKRYGIRRVFLDSLRYLEQKLF